MMTMNNAKAITVLTTGSHVVPDGTSFVRFKAKGADGAGGVNEVAGGGGGQGGGFLDHQTPVAEADWGTSITVSIGIGASGADGTDTTISGTLNGTAFTLTAGGGDAGRSVMGGTGKGIATGGNVTNINGTDGGAAVTTPVDEAAPGVGGANGTPTDEPDIQPSTAPGGSLAPSVAGDNGMATVEWG